MYKLNFRLSIDYTARQDMVYTTRKIYKKGKEEKGEKRNAYIMRGIYITFKSLERLIIIVIISR